MNYHLFVIPFCAGAVFLFGTIFYFFFKWLHYLSSNQKEIVKKNIFSLRTAKAVWEAIRECLFHRNIFKTNILLGYMHLGLAFGWFLLIVVGKIETTFYSRTFWDDPWLAIFFRYFEDPTITFTGKYFFNFIMDFLLLFVLSALFLAIIKRSYSKIVGLKRTTKHSIRDKITLTALWCIFPFRLLAESISAGIKNNGGFLTQSIGNALSFMPLKTIELSFWWAYSLALCIFFIGMPFTRYMHIFTEILLVFLRKWGVTEEKNRSGYTSIELNACSRCGICIDVCPLNTALDIKNVQSAYFIRDIRNNLLSNEIADNCLMCDRCVSACPVGVKSTKIREIYREKDSFENKNYYHFIDETFTKMAEVIYFAGCMSHLISKTIASMKQIFYTANQDFWFMDEEKNICCGRPLLQQGFKKQSEILRDKNTELIKKSGARLLVTSCPICYQSFIKEYNLKIEILHHTQYIDRLITNKIIQPKKTDLNIVYHDSCELGRGCDIYEEPRKIIRTIGNLLSSQNEKENSVCCGYNLGNTMIELDQQMQIRNNSLKNLTKTNPDMIATACPMCKRAFSHGKEETVLDIAEIVARQF